MKSQSSLATGVLVLAIAGVVVLTAKAGSLQPVSTLDTALAPAVTGNGDSWNPLMTPDGRCVVFASLANNLLTATNAVCAVPTPWRMNVFLRDRTNAATVLVSLNRDGIGGGNGDSVPAGLSSDGRYVLFESSATDLVPGDTNNAADVFVRDLVAGTTALISARPDGGCANGDSGDSVVTPDGRYVAFASAASDLADNDTNGIADIFVRDLRTGTTVLASPGAMSNGTNSSSGSPQITPDGHYVVFLSAATNLVPGVTSPKEVYLRDLVSGTTHWVSAGAHDFIPTGAACFNPLISDNGQYVVYQASPLTSNATVATGFILRYALSSGRTDLVSSNAIAAYSGLRHLHGLDMTPDGRFVAFVGRPDSTVQSTNLCVYRWDAQTGAAVLVSADVNNALPTAAVSDWPVMDSTGRFVAFLCTATNLTTNGVAGEFHLYARDVQSSTTRLLDLGANGAAGAKSFMSAPRFSPDARLVAFDCTDADLVPNDSNQAYDVFLYDLSNGTVELESTNQPGPTTETARGGISRAAFAVSADGWYVVFVSAANNLTPEATNTGQALYRRDRVDGTTVLVSADVNGLPAGGGWFADPSVSADGRYVAFTSSATNLVPGGTDGQQNVFVRDMQLGTNYLVSVNTNGTGGGNLGSYSPVISTNGLRVLFHSQATNLVSVTTTGGENCFLRDLQTGLTYAVTTAGCSCSSMTPDGHFVAYGRSGFYLYLWDAQTASTVYTNTVATNFKYVAVSPDGKRLAGQSWKSSYRTYAADRVAATNWLMATMTNRPPDPTLQFSGDGQFLVFVTAASLVANDNNTKADVYLFDFQSQATFLVSHSYSSGAAANDVSDSPSFSANSRFVAFRSFASDIVPGDTNGMPDVFLYDRETGSTRLLSSSVLGDFAGNNRSGGPGFSGDSETVLFQSWASDLVTGDFNQGNDLFALSLVSPTSVPDFTAEIFSTAAGTSQFPTLAWRAQPGASYRVQFKDDLSDLGWQNMNGTVTVVGTHAYAVDFSPSRARRFYRILAF